MNNKLKAIAEELFPTRMHFYSEISAVKSLLYKTAYRRVSIGNQQMVKLE